MDPPTIERLGPADANRAAALFHAYRGFYAQQDDPGRSRDFLARRLANGESVVFLASAGGSPAGFAQLYPSFSSVRVQRDWVLNDLFVDAAHRGRGVGRALLDACAGLVRETGARGMSLVTASDNAPARRLYERYGFTPETAFVTYHWHP